MFETRQDAEVWEMIWETGGWLDGECHAPERITNAVAGIGEACDAAIKRVPEDDPEWFRLHAVGGLLHQLIFRLHNLCDEPDEPATPDASVEPLPF